MIGVYIFTFILGSIIGSFLSCTIHRLHSGTSFLHGRSHCPQCRNNLSWYELIPVISYLVLRGKCRVCKSKISIQDILIELVSGALFVLAVYMRLPEFPALVNYLEVVRDWIIISISIVIFVYDLRWQLILDKVTIPAAVVILIINLGISVFHTLGTMPADVWSVLLSYILNMIGAALIGGGFFFLQFVVSKGRWIGGGDIRLGALMGLILGWPLILVALMLAYIVGAIISVGMLALKVTSWKSPIPFGTFLTAATLVAMYWGNEIMVWYLSII